MNEKKNRYWQEKLSENLNASEEWIKRDLGNQGDKKKQSLNSAFVNIDSIGLQNALSEEDLRQIIDSSNNSKEDLKVLADLITQPSKLPPAGNLKNFVKLDFCLPKDVAERNQKGRKVYRSDESDEGNIDFDNQSFVVQSKSNDIKALGDSTSKAYEVLKKHKTGTTAGSLSGFDSFNYLSIKKKIDLTPHLVNLHEKKKEDKIETSQHLENIKKIITKKQNDMKKIQAESVKNDRETDELGYNLERILKNLNERELLERNFEEVDSEIQQYFERASSFSDVSFKNEASNKIEKEEKKNLTLIKSAIEAYKLETEKKNKSNGKREIKKDKSSETPAKKKTNQSPPKKNITNTQVIKKAKTDNIATTAKKEKIKELEILYDENRFLKQELILINKKLDEVIKTKLDENSVMNELKTNLEDTNDLLRRKDNEIYELKNRFEDLLNIVKENFQGPQNSLRFSENQGRRQFFFENQMEIESLTNGSLQGSKVKSNPEPNTNHRKSSSPNKKTIWTPSKDDNEDEANFQPASNNLRVEPLQFEKTRKTLSDIQASNLKDVLEITSKLVTKNSPRLSSPNHPSSPSANLNVFDKTKAYRYPLSVTRKSMEAPEQQANTPTSNSIVETNHLSQNSGNGILEISSYSQIHRKSQGKKNSSFIRKPLEPPSYTEKFHQSLKVNGNNSHHSQNLATASKTVQNGHKRALSYQLVEPENSFDEDNVMPIPQSQNGGMLAKKDVEKKYNKTKFEPDNKNEKVFQELRRRCLKKK